MDMRDRVVKKGFVLCILLLLAGASFLPNVCGNSKDYNKNTVNILPEKIQSQDETSMKFFIFGGRGFEITNDIMSSDDALNIVEIFEELQACMIENPFGEKTRMLKRELIDLLGQKGLISKESSFEEINNLFSMNRFNFIQNQFNGLTKGRSLLSDSSVEKMCVINSNGSGILFPILFVMFPRPRFLVYWDAVDGNTTIINILTMMGFEANGEQKGLGLGCITGMGMVRVESGGNRYWLIAMALWTRVTADIIDPFP